MLWMINLILILYAAWASPVPAVPSVPGEFAMDGILVQFQEKAKVAGPCFNGKRKHYLFLNDRAALDEVLDCLTDEDRYPFQILETCGTVEEVYNANDKFIHEVCMNIRSMVPPYEQNEETGIFIWDFDNIPFLFIDSKEIKRRTSVIHLSAVKFQGRGIHCRDFYVLSSSMHLADSLIVLTGIDAFEKLGVW